MSWVDSHKASELAAIEAETIQHSGDVSRAVILYAQAANYEQEALADLDEKKARTRGITAVSAVSLWFKAEAYERAEQLAHLLLSDASLPDFAQLELRNLLQVIWTESAKRNANINFLPGQILVSVKGGEVITGGAPLELIVEKVQTIQSMFYRTVEFVNGLPLRRKGGPPKEIQEVCRPWLLQAPPGSYQFSVVIQQEGQRELFIEDKRPEQVVQHFLEILQATANEDPRQLELAVPQPEYRAAFLKLSRNLAPASRSASSIELKIAAADSSPIELTQNTRTIISRTLRNKHIKPAGDEVFDGVEEEELTGILRAVDLEKDYLDLMMGESLTHVGGVSDELDDVIGPMVNKAVRLRVSRDRRGKFQLNDIELDG